MRSMIGIENMESDALYEWLGAYRDDIRHCADYPAIGWKSHAWALQTCTRIVAILARRNYDPRTKKPPKRVEFASAAYESPNHEVSL
ncbi:hypothetical protein GC170_14640 [bacterium]|nr:hypothetical protein [bacterium]